MRERNGHVGRQLHGASGVGGGGSGGGRVRTAQPGETLQRDGGDGRRGHLVRPHLWLQVVSVVMRQENEKNRVSVKTSVGALYCESRWRTVFPAGQMHGWTDHFKMST